MISTPIGPMAEAENISKTASVTPTLQQPQYTSTRTAASPSYSPTLQPQFVPNILGNQPNQTHTFPVLYNNPLITTTSPLEVQPVSLYSEYIDNPYNAVTSLEANNSDNANISEQTAPVADVNALWAQYLYQKQNLQYQSDLDSNKNVNESSVQHIDNKLKSDVFKSSNYFSMEAGAIPPGSEILFGAGQASANIPSFPNVTSSGN